MNSTQLPPSPASLAAKPPKTPFTRYRRIVLITAGVLALLPFLFIIYVLLEMPSLRSLENPQTNLSTQVLSSDKQLLGAYYAKEHRINIKLSDIPLNFQQALIATEDVRFYDHSGLDPAFVFTAPFRILLGDTRGGSTLTQQLARNLYDAVGKERTLVRKIKEAIVAVVLERRFTKGEILTSYLNTVSFGGNSYGLEAGAKAYYNKTAKELTPDESALLVGMLKGPTYYSPIRYPQRAKDRRNTVLEQMVKYDYLTRQEGEKWKQKPIQVSLHPGESHNEGLAPYFREYLRGWLKEWCDKRNLDLYTSGLKIYTTIDSRHQRYAEEATREYLPTLQQQLDRELKGREPWKKDTSILMRGMTQSARYNMAKSGGKSTAAIYRQFHTKQPMQVFTWRAPGYIDTVMTPWDSIAYYARFLQPGLITIDPANGHVLAWVGGLDHRFFQYDHVRLGKRQVGSTFKPFVYTAAFDNGFSPCHEELNMPVEVETADGQWAPQNSDRTMGGYLTLRKALALSVNLITARLIKAIGPQVVAEYAYKMGIESKLDAVPSLALGTTDLTVYELTSAYATFANKGRWHEPIFVTRIEDKFGNVLEEFLGNSREALSEETAYLMVDMLRGVVNEGTAANLRWMYKLNPKIDIGGKTGTTQQHADGWFEGITPFFACGVWVGCSDRSVAFRDLLWGQGGKMAMPIWGAYMKKVYEDKELNVPTPPFTRPRLLKVEIDCATYRARHGTRGRGAQEQKRPEVLDFDN